MASIKLYQIDCTNAPYGNGSYIIMLAHAEDGSVHAAGWTTGNYACEWTDTYSVQTVAATAGYAGIKDPDVALAISQTYDADLAPYLTVGSVGLSMLQKYKLHGADREYMIPVWAGLADTDTSTDVQIRDANNNYQVYTAVEDGGRIDVVYPDRVKTITVQHIDATHMYAGSDWCYHVDQYAEAMQRQCAYCRPHMIPVLDLPAPDKGPEETAEETEQSAETQAEAPAEQPAEADHMLHIDTGTGSIDLDPAGLLRLPVANVRKIARLTYADRYNWDSNLDKIRDFCRPLQNEKPTTAKSRARILQIWTDLDPATATAAAPVDTNAMQLSRTAAAAVKRIAKSAAKILHNTTGYHTDGATVCITDGHHGVSYPGTTIPGAGVGIDVDHPRDIIRAAARDYQYHPGVAGLTLKAVRTLQRTGMDVHGNAATHVHIDDVGYYNLQQLVNVLSAIDAPCDCYVRPERNNLYILIFVASDIYGVVTPCNWTDSNVERNNWVAVDLPGAAKPVTVSGSVQGKKPAKMPAEAPAKVPAEIQTAAGNVSAADAPADTPWWTPVETMIATWAKSSGYKCAAYTGSHPIVYNIHSSYIRDTGKTLDDVATEARALPGVRVNMRDSYIAIVPVPADAPTPAPVLDTDVIAAALQPAEQPTEVPAAEPSIMDQLQAIPGLNITTRKTTIWIAGQTYPARAQLKAMGCRWSAKRKAWYYQEPRPAAVIPDGLTVVKQTSACTWVDGPADLLQAAGAKWSAKRQAWYVA